MKLQWLCVDRDSRGFCQGKDLVDAVILAELDGVRLSGGLVGELLRRVPRPESLRPDVIPRWRVDWSTAPERSGAVWLERLAAAMEATPELTSRLR